MHTALSCWSLPHTHNEHLELAHGHADAHKHVREPEQAPAVTSRAFREDDDRPVGPHAYGLEAGELAVLAELARHVARGREDGKQRDAAEP